MSSSNFFAALANFVQHIGNRSVQISASIQEIEAAVNQFIPVATAAVATVFPKAAPAVVEGVQAAETVANAVAAGAAAVGQVAAPPAAPAAQ